MIKEKLTRVIKSRITVGVVCFLLGGAILGGGSVEQPIKEVGQDTVQEGHEQAKGDNGTEDKKPQSELMEMETGKSYSVTRGDGEYNLMVEGIRFTDERNQFSEKPAEHVFFLDFNYENVSSSEEIYIFDSHFKIMDEEGNVLNTYPVSDEARGSKTLPMGGKCSASVAYAMPTSSKTLKILFYDNMFGKPIGQVTVETGL